MLTHQAWDSEGPAAANIVSLSSRTVSNFRVDLTCHSGVRLVSDGVLHTLQANGNLSQVTGEWLVNGTPATFFVQRTIISGTLESDPGAGFLQLNTTRDYDNQKASVGVKTTVVFFEISDDVSGIPVIDTATMTFISEQETGE